MSALRGFLEALSMAFGMAWEILWALILDFALSAAVLAWRFLRTGGPEMLKEMGQGYREEVRKP